MTEPRSRKEMNVKVVRLTTTEDVVADLLEETDDSVTIRGGIVAVPTKDGNIGFASWTPLLASPVEDITISKSNVVYVGDPNPALIDHYVNQFSKILGVVPVLGEVLTGLDKTGVFATQFSIKGNFEDPKVSVNASSLAPGLLRDLFSPDWLIKERERIFGKN